MGNSGIRGSEPVKGRFFSKLQGGQCSITSLHAYHQAHLIENRGTKPTLVSPTAKSQALETIANLSGRYSRSLKPAPIL